MALFDPDSHESLTRSRWDEQRVRLMIEQLAARTIDAYVPARFWPRHPRDEYGGTSVCDKGLWIGAAGVLWALDRLGAGIGEAGVYDAYLSDQDSSGSTGLMMGETGVALVSWKLAPTATKEQRLFELVEGNVNSASHELFNGAPGTMLAALHVYESTESDRWRELWQRCADAVWEQFRQDPELDCRIWVQYRRGRLIRSVGAGHGFASNVRSLLRGETLLAGARAEELTRAAAETACRLAAVQDGLVNWPTAADTYWAEQFPMRVQWCHGAPGLLTGLRSLPHDERLDDLFRGAGELIWKAGPLRKGAGLCHGTSGNGFALLALHARFGDDHWLDRARAFAAHAIEQIDLTRPRHSLWTGDIGVALYLRACLDGFDGMPSLDTL
jgi:Lanthionine synthetase C-like protein